MKFVAILAVCVAAALAQTAPADFVAAGASYNQGGSPAIAGTAAYGHLLSDGLYSFTAIDILPTSFKPFTTQTAITTGIGKRFFTVAGIPVYALATAGASTTGIATGWTWTTGGAAVINLGKGWVLIPNARPAKSSVGGWAYVYGILIGWGK